MGGAQPTTLSPPTLIPSMQSPLPTTLPECDRSGTKEALLVGIGYREASGWEPIPSSIPNVRKFETFLRGERPILSLALPRLYNPFASSRASRVYEDCRNDRRR